MAAVETPRMPPPAPVRTASLTDLFVDGAAATGAPAAGEVPATPRAKPAAPEMPLKESLEADAALLADEGLGEEKKEAPAKLTKEPLDAKEYLDSVGPRQAARLVKVCKQNNPNFKDPRDEAPAETAAAEPEGEAAADEAAKPDDADAASPEKPAAAPDASMATPDAKAVLGSPPVPPPPTRGPSVAHPDEEPKTPNSRGVKRAAAVLEAMNAEED